MTPAPASRHTRASALSNANTRRPNTPASAQPARWWPRLSRRRPHRQKCERGSHRRRRNSNEDTITPESPNSHFGWSMAGTRGHNSTRRPQKEEQKSEKWEYPHPRETSTHTDVKPAPTPPLNQITKITWNVTRWQRTHTICTQHNVATHTQHNTKHTTHTEVKFATNELTNWPKSSTQLNHQFGQNELAKDELAKVDQQIRDGQSRTGQSRISQSQV